jgi:hypothetical protein
VKRRYLIVVVLAALTVWAAVTHPWIAPGFAALAAGQTVLAAIWLRAGSGRASQALLLGFLALSCLGLAYLLAVQIGTPATAHFWIVFGVGLAILAPVVLLAQRLLRIP